ncbi:MAG TPA: DUF192 domain-containing protein [Steroidobacter sp.]|nr:DUF192 domain-containing protein [Steroidobacter sp.]
MKTIALQTADGRCVAQRVQVADSMLSRAIGLIRRRALNAHEGLLLVPGGGIHTIGVRFPIDVVFLDGRMRILALAPELAPRRLRWAPVGCRRVLELAAGRIAALRLHPGMQLMVRGEHDRSDELARMRRSHSHEVGRPPCRGRPIQFSLLLPLKHRGGVRSNLGCEVGRLKIAPRPTPPQPWRMISGS